MSRHNKVNKTNYVQQGRLTPDEMAQERMRQERLSGTARKSDTVTGRAQPKRGGPGPSRPRSAPEE